MLKTFYTKIGFEKCENDEWLVLVDVSLKAINP